MADPLTIGLGAAGAVSGLLKGDGGQDKLARISEKEFVRRSAIEDEDRARKLAQDRKLLPVRQQLLQALAGKLGLPPEIMAMLGGGGGGGGDRQLGDLPMRGPLPIGGTINPGPGARPGPVPPGGQRPMNDLPMRPPMTVGGGGDRQLGDLLMQRPSTLDDFGQEQGTPAWSSSPLRKLLAGRLGMQR